MTKIKNLKFKIKNFSHGGFTLIELLVVISIIGVLAVLVATNLNEARARARDVKKKENATQLKTALRIYYNDYMSYPTTGNGLAFNACGASGTSACDPNTGIFSAGSGPTVYMKGLVKSGNNFEFKYYPCDNGGGNSYVIKVTLENASDPDITASQTRCPNSSCVLPGGSTLGAYSTTDYIVCAD